MGRAIQEHEANLGNLALRLIETHFSRNGLTQCSPLTDFIVIGDSSGQGHKAGIAARLWIDSCFELLDALERGREGSSMDFLGERIA